MEELKQKTMDFTIIHIPEKEPSWMQRHGRKGLVGLVVASVLAPLACTVMRDDAMDIQVLNEPAITTTTILLVGQSIELVPATTAIQIESSILPTSTVPKAVPETTLLQSAETLPPETTAAPIETVPLETIPPDTVPQETLPAETVAPRTNDGTASEYACINEFHGVQKEVPAEYGWYRAAKLIYEIPGSTDQEKDSYIHRMLNDPEFTQLRERNKVIDLMGTELDGTKHLECFPTQAQLNEALA